MTIEAELAAYVNYLQKRVDRLKTLEEAAPAAAGAWTYITEVILTVAGTVTFTSIPQTYDDLMLIWRARSDEAVGNNRDEVCARFNNDATGGNYDTADGAQNSGGTCYKDSGFVIIGHCTNALSTGSADSFAAGVCYIPEYTNTSYKLSTQGFAASFGILATFGLPSHCIGCWSTYNAVTRIDLFPRTGANFLADSIFELYGLTR